jgi:Tol biopolymer transport system component
VRAPGVVAATVASALVAFAAGDFAASAANSHNAADAYWILVSSDRDGTTRTYSLGPDGSRLTPLLPSVYALTVTSVSSDRRLIAYRDRRGIYVSRADGAGLRQVARGAIDYAALSPTGRQIAFVNKGRVWVVGVDGRGLRRLTPGPSDLDFVWSPNGRLLAFVRDGRGIWVVGRDGRGLRRVTAGDDDNSPEWSGNGKALLFAFCRSDCDADAGIAVQPLHGKRRVLALGDVDFPRWSPGGRWIAYTRYVQDFDRDDLWFVRPDGKGRHRVARDVSADYDWLPDGRRLVYAGCGGFCIVGFDGGASGAIRLNGLRVGDSFAWSPDARELFFAARAGDFRDPFQIWAVGIDGRELRRLTNEGRNGVIGWTRMTPVLPPAAAVPATEAVLGADAVATRAPVALLVADGARAALVTKPPRTDCYHVALWSPGDQSVRRIGPLPAPCFDEAPHIAEVALTPSRVAFTVGGSYGSDTCEYTLEAGALSDARALPLVDVAGESCTVQEYFHLHGDGELLVFNDGSRLLRIGGGTDRCGLQSPLKTSTCRLLRGNDARSVDSVSEGLIAVRKPGAVAVVDQQGTIVRSISFTPADVSAARLDGKRLVVWRFGALEVYDVATGSRVSTRPMPTGYRLADADGGIAVLLRAGAVMLLRLDDGRSYTLAPGGEPALADLEGPGLYYSYATGDGGGRVAFLPRAQVLRRLDGGA